MNLPPEAFELYRNGAYPYALTTTETAATLEFASVSVTASAGDRYADPSVAVYPTETAADVDVTVRWAWHDTGSVLPFTLARGVGVCARLPGGGAPGYHVSARATTSNVTITALGAAMWASGDGVDFNVIAEETAPFGGFAPGTDYCLRVIVTETGEKRTRFQARVWAAADAEPTTWALDATLDGNAGTPNERARWTAGPGPIGVSTAGEGSISTGGAYPPGARGRRYTIKAVSLHSAAVPTIDAPVTVHFSEALTGVFADPTVDAAFFQLVDLPVGSRYALGDQISSDDWYAFAVRDKSISGGLVTYAGETLLATLGRVTPTESLILVAGQGGVPTPLTLRECLVRFLTYYGVPFNPNVPEFSLRVGDELVTPTADAFVIQPNQENPESLYEWLERFFGPFRGYTFRADYQDRLSVSPPAWLDTIGLRLTVHRRRQPLDREPVRSTVRAPWSTTRAPEVEWVGTVDGVAVSGSLPDPLVQGAAAEIVTVGGVDVRLTWDAAVVQAMVWPTPDVDVSVGSLYSVTFVFRPDATTSSSETLALTLADLAPDEVTSESADTVVNQAVLPVRRREFTPAQQVMQAGALVLRSPKQVMAGAFGANPEYGPMAEPLTTPGSFLELANTVGQSGTWFWPADPLVVAQPGGNITVAFEVEEWAERWYDPTSHDAAAQVNTYSDTAALPASGVEVKLFDFQFPRQTNDFAPSPYGAQGTVYGRWRAGEQPGIEVRVGNARFAEFGFKPEVLIFGTTTYYLWGVIVKLNGTGTAFTEGTLETYRFGFARGANGLWEDDANVPGLSESQALYPNRVYHAPELPYVVSPETALALARGIVEENLTPKVVRQLTIVPARADGYAVRPHHVGRAAAVPALGITGRITALDYSEAHTAQGSTSSLTIDVESTEAPSGSRAAARAYRRSAYGLSTYQKEN